MKKIWGVAILMLVVGGLLGYGISAYYQTSATQSAYQQGMAYQASITPTTHVGTPASLDCSLDVVTYDHTATVLADGSVAGDVSVDHTLTVKNTDDTATAKNVYIMLWNPVTQKKGLDADIAVKYTYVYINVGGVTKSIYNDGYTNGYFVGDLAPGDSVVVTVGITLKTAPADTYVDAQTYDTCKLYVVQPDISYADAVAFTVLT
jgi:hypothetical protein